MFKSLNLCLSEQFPSVPATEDHPPDLLPHLGQSFPPGPQQELHRVLPRPADLTSRLPDLGPHLGGLLTHHQPGAAVGDEAGGGPGGGDGGGTAGTATLPA